MENKKFCDFVEQQAAFLMKRKLHVPIIFQIQQFIANKKIG